MKITGYGQKEITFFLILGILGMALFALIGWLTDIWWIYLFCVIPGILTLFTLYFFRDPSRKIPNDDLVVVAPADGKITEIAEVEENTYLKTNSKKIGIFLSLFNVHLNRAPYAGRVEYLKYTPGKFLNAGNLESSKVNESNAIGISTDRCKILLRQISGVIARRIVCKLNEGDVVETGQRFGMIKFGSRTEFYVPADSKFELRVTLGQKVKAGETIIGVFKSEEKN